MEVKRTRVFKKDKLLALEKEIQSYKDRGYIEYEEHLLHPDEPRLFKIVRSTFRVYEKAVAFKNTSPKRGYYLCCFQKKFRNYLHRIKWEAFNGPIPEGYVITFRDGDTSNIRLDNLLLVNRGKLMSKTLANTAKTPGNLGRRPRPIYCITNEKIYAGVVAICKELGFPKGTASTVALAANGKPVMKKDRYGKLRTRYVHQVHGYKFRELTPEELEKYNAEKEVCNG